MREWRGRTHTVVVTEDGLEYAGKAFPSLTKNPPLCYSDGIERAAKFVRAPGLKTAPAPCVARARPHQ